MTRGQQEFEKAMKDAFAAGAETAITTLRTAIESRPEITFLAREHVLEILDACSGAIKKQASQSEAATVQDV